MKYQIICLCIPIFWPLSPPYIVFKLVLSYLFYTNMLEDHLVYVHKIQAIYDVVEPSACKVVAKNPNCMAQQK